MPDANYRSYVDRVAELGGEPVGGEWGDEALSPSKTNVAQHEIGHLLGLADQYSEVVFDGRGHRAAAPRGMETDITGEIRDRERWTGWARRKGIDPRSMTVGAVIKPGHGRDIMGDHLNPRARFREADLRKLLRAAGTCRDEDIVRLSEAPATHPGKGPRAQARQCYTPGRGPLSGKGFRLANGNLIELIPYPVGGQYYELDGEVKSGFPNPSTQLLRYKGLAIDEAQKVKIACRWRAELAYVRELNEWLQSLQFDLLRPFATRAALSALGEQAHAVYERDQALHRIPVHSGNVAQIDAQRAQIRAERDRVHREIRHIQWRLEQAEMDAQAVEEEIEFRLATVSRVFGRSLARPVRGYPRRDLRAATRLEHSLSREQREAGADFKATAKGLEDDSYAAHRRLDGD